MDSNLEDHAADEWRFLHVAALDQDGEGEAEEARQGRTGLETATRRRDSQLICA